MVSPYGWTLPSTRDTYARTTCPFRVVHDGAPASSSFARVRPVSRTDIVWATYSGFANSSGKRRM